jgi:hypothetical protein
MNRSLFVLALSAFAVPAFSMTATVSSSSQPVVAPAAADAASKANASVKAAAVPAAGPAAAMAKSSMPNAASVTRPSATLSAPGIPMKSTAAVSAKPSAAKPASILPAAAPQAQAMNTPSAKTSAAWSAVASNNSPMHAGTLQAVNVGAGTFQVYGQKLNFNAQRVKVFGRDGKPASTFGLKAGASVRFTLDPSDSRRRRVAVIYIN